MPTLGELKRVDLRSMWPNEAADFTPWLASEGQIAALGQALGLELEVENTEVAVGPYSADILAKESATGGYVVIENQLGKTDHDHLGKAITYASTLSARAIVWLAGEFTDEHRRAVDWLNSQTIADLGFYAVRVELWQVDDSKPAVRFNVLARPALDPKLALAQAGSKPVSETRRLQLEFWSGLRDLLLERKAVGSAQAPRAQYWYNVALGRSGYHLSAIADTFGDRIGLRVYMRGMYGAEQALEQLLQQKAQIEAEVGCALEWNPNPETTDKIISVHREADLRQRENWPEYHAWLLSHIISFKAAFGPRVKQLVLEENDDTEASVPLSSREQG